MIKLQVGQKVWLQDLNRKGSLSEAEVIEVGRLYFKTNIYSRYKFSIKELVHVTDRMPQFRVWLSVEDYEAKKRHSQLAGKVGMWFYRHSAANYLTTEQLIEIDKIINPKDYAKENEEKN